MMRTIRDQVAVSGAGHRVPCELSYWEVQIESIDWHPCTTLDTEEMFNIVGKIQTMRGLVEADAQLVVFALSRPKKRAEIHVKI
jgi:hypothetical protein